MIIGSEVYFFYTCFGKNSWGDEDTIVCPDYVELLRGEIVNMDEDKDYVHIYVKGIKEVVSIPYCFHEKYIFESVSDAIEEMTKQLQNL